MFAKPGHILVVLLLLLGYVGIEVVDILSMLLLMGNHVGVKACLPWVKPMHQNIVKVLGGEFDRAAINKGAESRVKGINVKIYEENTEKLETKRKSEGQDEGGRSVGEKEMAKGGGGKEELKLDRTPTWIVAVVCTVIICISLFFE
ncbi:hypothetical protein IEQ34_006728 [Dendrobium chrysotoxum]|uniref:Uncharacterized protein n=1 Tax=Dendrobium chrysotoxum TaxID=161865 RepID=A0AAV7H6B6_DENCH|nr:hypothetical protein IEQ34_006728 [Dendrobium chrysotoxum]